MCKPKHDNTLPVFLVLSLLFFGQDILKSCVKGEATAHHTRSHRRHRRDLATFKRCAKPSPQGHSPPRLQSITCRNLQPESRWPRNQQVTTCFAPLLSCCSPHLAPNTRPKLPACKRSTEIPFIPFRFSCPFRNLLHSYSPTFDQLSPLHHHR